jgi:hypothetical protein
MTQDFTRIGQKPDYETQNASPLAPNLRIVLLSIYFSAAGFLAAGIWLASGRPSPFPQESAELIGYAFIFVAALDGVCAVLLKRYWGKAGKS